MVIGPEKNEWRNDLCGPCEKLKRKFCPFDDIIAEFLHTSIRHLAAH